MATTYRRSLTNSSYSAQQYLSVGHASTESAVSFCMDEYNFLFASASSPSFPLQF